MSKRKLANPKFTEEQIKKLASDLQLRCKFDEGYGTRDFDEWEAAFKLQWQDKITGELFRQFQLNEHNPYQWRALLELLIKDAVRFEGRGEKWSRDKLFELAFDVVQLGKRTKNEDNASQAAADLQRNEPYRSRYRGENFDQLRKKIGVVYDMIGPIDSEAILRLTKINPDHFMECFLRHVGITEADLSRWD